AGRLWRYPTATGKLGTGTQIGAGFTGVKSVHVADWNGDGILDLIVQWSNGRLSLYPGISAGSFNNAVTLANSGWGGYDLTVGQWITASKFPTIVAQSADGTLTSFTSTDGTSLTAGTVLARGMTRMHPVMTDFDGDGNADIVAINNLGQLILYRSNGKGAFVSEQRPVVGNGWQVMTSVSPATSYTSTGSAGILARTAGGALMYYPILKSSFGPPITLATGWNGTTIVGGSAFLAPQQAITSLADVVAADSSGTLWNYSATGSGTLAAPYPIGVGWTGLKSLHVVDWNSDGVPDVLAQWSNGAMTLYPGASGGGFARPLTLASTGWGSVKFITGRWVTGSTYPGLVGTNGLGDLYYWPNKTGGTLGTAQKIGTGWGTLKTAMQDFDSDGNQDLLAIDPLGTMRLYRSNGTGGFVIESRPAIGSGWSSFSRVSGVNGFTGLGSKGVLAQSPTGLMRYYPIGTNSSWSAPVAIPQAVLGATIS
ncbi:FG-GAP repeat domain-containing protein, partial [Arthrobacter sp. A2-55]|uniref:FG-GAP repeat domain-containing protein n=1 Tax=Arthrobacter sp. A2-55 TaxID=2897337 RepID=UPI0021CDC185